MRILALFLGVMVWAPLIHAQSALTPNRLVVQETPAQTQFTFYWLYQGKPQTLSFTLPREDLIRGVNEFKSFSNAASQKYALAQAQQKAATLSTPTVQFSVTSSGKHFSIDALSAASDASTTAMVKTGQGQIKQAYDAALAKYIQEAFYTSSGPTSLMPDHPRIAKRYTPALAPVVASIRTATEGLTQRQQIDWVMGFLQSIPYDTLMDRRTSNGSGFQTPYGLFRANKGDCDTKSVAMLAILRGLYPKLPLAMLYVPEHAFVGVGLPQGPNDYALRLDKQIYILADPTGPATLKLGQADARALSLLKRKDYSYKAVPF